MKNSEAPFFYSANSNTFGNAKALRKNMTSTEMLLWNELKSNKLNGIRFRRQHPIGVFIVDFYCHRAKLVIEVDGEIHNQSEIKEKDAQREFELQQLGLKVIRFSNEDIESNLKQVLTQIRALL